MHRDYRWITNIHELIVSRSIEVDNELISFFAVKILRSCLFHAWRARIPGLNGMKARFWQQKSRFAAFSWGQEHGMGLIHFWDQASILFGCPWLAFFLIAWNACLSEHARSCARIIQYNIFFRLRANAIQSIFLFIFSVLSLWNSKKMYMYPRPHFREPLRSNKKANILTRWKLNWLKYICNNRRLAVVAPTEINIKLHFVSNPLHA